MTIQPAPPLPETLTIGVLGKLSVVRAPGQLADGAALQGAFIEHIHYVERYAPLPSYSSDSFATCRLTSLRRLRIKDHTLVVIPVRTLSELERCHALIMPGGESTTISLLASHTPGMLEGLKAFVQDPAKAVWGTCAGMILMSDEDRGIGGGKIRKVDGGSLGGWGGIKGLRVWRNLYGSESSLLPRLFVTVLW